MIFSYKARDRAGATRSGTLEGSSVGDVAQKLQARGLEALEVQPLSGKAPAASLPAPTGGGWSEKLAEIQWPRLLLAMGGLVLLLVLLGGLPRLFRSKKVAQVTLTGSVEVNGDASFSRGNTKVYVYFPEVNRTVRADGQQFELEGGHLVPGRIAKWLPYQDSASQYDIDWKETQFTLKVSFTSAETPKHCRLTIRKTGFLRGRSAEVTLESNGPESYSASVPPIRMVQGRNTLTGKGDRSGGNPEERDSRAAEGPPSGDRDDE